MLELAQPRPDDVCEYEGEPIKDIILVGRLLRRLQEPMRTHFEINDNTGSFKIIFYHKGEHQIPTALKHFEYEQYSYAKVYGSIKVFKETKQIVGTHMQRIEDFNELSNHFLSVFVSHMLRRKGVIKHRDLQQSPQEF